MFADEDVGDAAAVGVFFVIIFAVHHHDDVGILFDGAGFAEVGELGDFAGAVLYSAGELGEGEDGDF